MAPFRRLVAGALLAWACASAVSSCGTDAMGTDACRKIEQARCSRAATCPELSLRGEVGLRQCMQFARDHCLHGLAVADPGPVAVDQCVAAIAQAPTCETVLRPETAPACAFLQPAPPPPDAGSDVGPEDAPSNTDGG